MPARVIRAEINTSQSLSRVSIGADLCFRALIVYVDDYGRCDARPQVLKGSLFPLRDDVGPAEIEGWVQELEGEGCVQAYETNGRQYLSLTGWEKHRGDTKRAARSKFPAPPGQEDPACTSCVYFVQSGEGGQVKIGWSSALENRIQTLRTMIPDLRLLGIVPSPTRALEKRLHRQFRDANSEGEWFHPTETLLGWIQQNAELPPPAAHTSMGRGVPGRAGTGRDEKSGHGIPDKESRVGVESRSREREPREGVGVGSGVGADAPRPGKSRGKKTDSPEVLPPEGLERLRGLRGDRRPWITDAQLNDGVENCLDWHTENGVKRADWVRACWNWIKKDDRQRRGDEPDPDPEAYRQRQATLEAAQQKHDEDVARFKAEVGE
jgi:hypothetical protein